MKRKSLYAIVDGKKEIDVLDEALKHNVMFLDEKRRIQEEYKDCDIEFIVK